MHRVHRMEYNWRIQCGEYNEQNTNFNIVTESNTNIFGLQTEYEKIGFKIFPEFEYMQGTIIKANTNIIFFIFIWRKLNIHI